MKKTFVVTLAVLFVLSIAGTAFAAANPFVDVPAKHWSYDAVAKLAKAGIIDGYGDGTFRGDKTMTRYEMAQIVAKAMAKSDKADAETKALVDKLAVEFAQELNNLGVRVAKLEKNQPNMKFTGTFDVRYRTVDYDAASTASDVNAFYRLRMEGAAKVDDKTTFGMRFVTNAPDKSDFGNTTWLKFGDSTNNAKIDRVFVATKVGEVNTTIGRQALVIDPLSIIVDSAAFSYDGVKLGWNTGKFNITANHGRFVKDVKYLDSNKNEVAALAAFKNVDVDSIRVASKVGKLAYGVNYAVFKNNIDDIDLATYYFGDVVYNFDKKFSLAGEYAKNDEANDNDNFWSVKATYGDQVLAAKGQKNFVVQYTDVKANSLFNRFTTLDTPNGNVFDDYKVLDLNYNYAFSANMKGQLQYVKVDDKTQDKFDYDYYKVTLSVKF
ncbi:S-layer domain protein domain protein [Thermosinus carboxydivorans Nor1]|uniref:S-layer domain protein domain protein n=1 Tax=Thermosinus carboxydivorans Nor1 TaxID=401526 RepID=A1HRI2_9FIRM|nr:S-layer homology domain-containing protein [Thermosinus carboxydivorans]EAX47313.1 S-layer domain protein domain protein [Thermosinus carboxydivorans Nor1]